MLVIGHRGAAGLAPENTLAAFKKGMAAGADILEFDVQLTRDNVPIVIHDSTLLRTHHKNHIIRLSSYASVKEATAKGHKITTLEEVLDTFFGKILLDLEVKNSGEGKIIAEFVKNHAIKKQSDWQNIIFSSFKVRELRAIRRFSKRAELALIHNLNPFAFLTHQRYLKFTAVGFHRLRVNRLAIEIAKRLGIFTYVYTVNRPSAAERLSTAGLDGIVTDRPDVIRQAVDVLTKYSSRKQKK